MTATDSIAALVPTPTKSALVIRYKHIDSCGGGGGGGSFLRLVISIALQLRGTMYGSDAV
jgi:hypothetical protein